MVTVVLGRSEYPLDVCKARLGVTFSRTRLSDHCVTVSRPNIPVAIFEVAIPMIPRAENPKEVLNISHPSAMKRNKHV